MSKWFVCLFKKYLSLKLVTVDVVVHKCSARAKVALIPVTYLITYAGDTIAIAMASAFLRLLIPALCLITYYNLFPDLLL